MKVLMLGNSFTYFHDLPQMLAALFHEEVDSVTRGGAYLYQMLDPQDELSAQVNAAISRESWDYIVLQEQSNAPVLKPDLFHPSVDQLCEIIRENGAKPVLYATWAYREGSPKLASTGMTYEEMDEEMYCSYHAAAERNHALVADVGKAFTALRGMIDPYEKTDDYHPSEAGSVLAAHVIARTILDDWNKR